MKRIAASVLLLVLLVAGCATPLSAVQRAHRSTVHLMMDDERSCSGTAIGPHAVLSASHCFEGAQSLSIDGSPVVITEKVSDGHDHTIVFVDITFPFTASLGPKPAMADPVFIIGNPGLLRDLFRAGYVSGSAVLDGTRIDLYDLSNYFGDSGSGIFGADGRLVGVVSLLLPQDNGVGRLQLTGAFPLAFTNVQWAHARGP